MVAELLADFCNDAARRLLRLRAAIDRNDAAAMKIEVHSIKGSAAQMGAERMAAACQRLELAVVRGAPAITPADADLIGTLFDEVSAAIGRHPLSGRC